ncbi:MAG: T9SS type A sorting domain-containing protein [Ignavibacteria bacterium]|nr:MAG: T9SS type A sorting domain-containing protein [Ignavibacteria bacterium]
MWKSTNGGGSFTYLGQPDGAQAAAATAGRAPGAGGGDEDISIGLTGRVDVASLWLGSITNCVSSNGGASWTTNPVSSNVPADDRQWLASYQGNIVYLTFQQLGALLTGTTSILVLKSTDGGLTFPQVTKATTPQFGVQPNVQGNIAVDKSNGYVYTVFTANPDNNVYIARSTDGGNTFAILLVQGGPAGTSYSNVFPILAVDGGGNIHVVFSDGVNVQLCSSSDHGTTWTAPVRVNNGAATRTALAPWIEAGGPGKVDIIWWGTSSANPLASSAQWNVFFAQTLDPFAASPTIAQNAATGVFHTGAICVNGTGCASGTRKLAEYASTTVYRDGMAMIVYPDDQRTSNPLSYFVKQTGGSAVLPVPSPLQSGGSAAGGPDRFALEQNYPNPFNPTSTISYRLAVESRATLRIYNLLGEVVQVLTDGVKQAGSETVAWDATILPSGTYFYKLEAVSVSDPANSVTLVRKAVLIR